jgi:hypothetical protein
MIWQAAVMYLVVAGTFLASFRNATAAALCSAWLAGELIYIFTGNTLPLGFFFMADIAVISIIYFKTIRRCGAKLYSSLGQQMRCLVTDLTTCDRWIVAIFLLGVWPAYILMIEPYWKWHLLWGLTILQFLLASAEAAQSFVAFLRTRAPSDPPDNGFALAGYWRHD